MSESAGITEFLNRLTITLAAEMRAREVGHCLRVEPMRSAQAMEAAALLRARFNREKIKVWVLAETNGDLEITSDRAIEIRNRKEVSLCLFVPAELQDAALSSLGNSFAVFNLVTYQQQLAKELLRELPDDDLQPFARALRDQLRKMKNSSAEQLVDYFASLLAEPTCERAGEDLWKVGLIPDPEAATDASPAARLERNRKCVTDLTQPRRIQASLDERIDALGLQQGEMREKLRRFLAGRSLHTDRDWLQRIAEEKELTFDHWQFHEGGPSELRSIEVEPFLDDKQIVKSFSRLKQQFSGGQLSAECGPKKFVTVKWSTVPKTPAEVFHWRVELVPCADEYDVDNLGTVDLPAVTVGKNARSAKVPLDVDVETLSVHRVNAVITPLDESGYAVCNSDGEIISATTLDFWLEAATADEGEEAERRRKMPTVRCFPDAYLRAAMETHAESRSAQPLSWDEKDLDYFPVLVNGHQTHRVGMSRFHRELEQFTLNTPDNGGRYVARVDGVDPLIMPVDEMVTEDDGVSTGIHQRQIQAPDGICGKWEDFLKARKQFFRAIREQEPRGFVEVAAVDENFIRRARAYGRAYLELLQDTSDCVTQPGEAAAKRQWLSDLCQVDTLFITNTGVQEQGCATVILSTHPLRVLWYVAYAELLRYFEEKVYALPEKKRKKSLSLENLERLSARNFPAFVPIRDGSLHVYAGDINFFLGLLLPADVADPGAEVQEVSRLLGYDADAVSQEVDATRVAREIQNYCEIHTYADALRLNVINPGGGELVRDTVLQLLKEPTEGERSPLDSLDIVTHVETDTLQRPAPGLEQLVTLGYQKVMPRRWSHLQPMIQVARRPIETIEQLPGHDTHLALCLDYFKPCIGNRSADPEEESASAYGLVARFRARFSCTENGVVWSHAIAYNLPSQIEMHPVAKAYTTDLISLHQKYLHACAQFSDAAALPTAVPCLTLTVGPEASHILAILHERADWVITIDRNFGIEYYDDMAHPELVRNAERYLLDYAPEFMEGMGHRMIVTTTWRKEVAGIITAGLEEMALSSDAESCQIVLNSLKAVSGRLALRLIKDTPQEKEAISLALLVEYLKQSGALADAFLIPMDAHPELLDPSGTVKEGNVGQRCDLLMVRYGRNLRFSFIEVKYRSGNSGIGEDGALRDRIAEQTKRTEDAFCEAFGYGNTDAEIPLDQAIRRSHLANVLHFYLERARRYNLLKDEAYEKLHKAIQKVEVELPRGDFYREGYVVCPNVQKQQKKTPHQGTTIYYLGAGEINQQTGISSVLSEDAIADKQGWDAPSAAGDSLNVDVGSVTPDDTPPCAETPSVVEKTVAIETQPNTLTDEDKKAEWNSTGPTSICVTLGEKIGTDTPCIWQPSTTGSPHAFIVGIPGQGKSVTIQRIIQSSVQQGLHTLALDFHGELAGAAPQLLQPSQYRIVNAAEGLPFSPFEMVGNASLADGNGAANAHSIAEIVAWVCDLGDIQLDLVYEAIRNCYRFSLEEDGGRLPTPDEVFAEAQRLEETRKVRNVIARIRPLFDADFQLFRPVAEQSLYDMIPGLGVVDLHNLGQETLQLSAGAFLLRKIYRDMLQWPNDGKLRLLVVLDEAHRLAKDVTLPKIMKEGRKFGVVIAGASQGLTDFHPDVLSNTGTKVIFRMNFPESRRVAGLVRGRMTEHEMSRKIESLSVGRAIVSTPEVAQPMECAMLQAEAARK